MTGYLRLHTLIGALLFFIGTSRAQTILPDTAASRLAALNTIEVYHSFMGPESRHYNGIEHIGYLPMNGHPYYLEDTAQTGSIVYENIWYRHIPILYDIVRDELVTPTPNGELMSLASAKVNEFFFLGHHFVKTSTGYYDVLCSGSLILEAKRIKKVLETIEGMTIVRNIEYTDHYFLVRDGVRHPINNLRSLLSFVKDKKKEINQDLKRKKIRYKKQPEAALVQAVTYYNQSLLQ